MISEADVTFVRTSIIPNLDAICNGLDGCHRGHVRLQAGSNHSTDIFHRTPVLAILSVSSFPPDGIEPARIQSGPAVAITERVGEKGYSSDRIGTPNEARAGARLGTRFEPGDEQLVVHTEKSRLEAAKREHKEARGSLDFTDDALRLALSVRRISQ
jgi:hypothetical protein